jgi:dienelactone hydrolase
MIYGAAVSRRAWSILITALIAFVLVGAGVIGSVRADDGLSRTSTVVDGVPLTVVRSAAADSEPRPGAVVAHGFAGSARLMYAFGDTLARNGYVVVLPDFRGHGGSRQRLDIDVLPADLDTAARFLRAQPGVDPGAIVLIGHSMGAGAVTRYAASHADIAATVAISLPSADDLPAAADRPRNLLLLYGGNEFPAFPAAARHALAAPDPTGTYTLGRTYGDPARGTARRADEVAGVEHISILFADDTHRATLAWVNSVVRPAASAGPVAPRARLDAAGLILLGLLVGFYPVAALLFRGPRAAGGLNWDVLGPGVGTTLFGALVVGAVAPDSFLGLAVGGYSTAVFAGFAAGGLAWGWRRGLPALGWPGGRTLVAGVLLTAYAAATVAVPSHLGFTDNAPIPQRWWLLAVAGVGAAGVFLAAELLGGRTARGHALVLAVATLALTALTMTGLGPAFTLLVLPLLVALFVIQGGFAAILRRFGAPAWVAAAVGAALLAWPVASTMPLV